MTRIILVLDIAGQGLYVTDDPRTPQELVMLINSGKLVVGAEGAAARTRTRQWALAHPGIDTITVLMKPPPVRLSLRLYQVLYGLADGKEASQIAEELGISDRMVQDLVETLKKRFDVVSRPAIIQRALELGMIDELE